MSLRINIYSTTLFVMAAKLFVASKQLMQQNAGKINTVEKIFLNAFPKDYDAEEAPSQVAVFVATLLLGVTSVDVSRKEIEAEFGFFASWNDNRLAFDETTREFGKTHQMIVVPDKVKKRLWVPWMAFTDCKKCKNGLATGKVNRPLYLMPAYGELFIFFRETMFFGCQYDLTYYPFDTHECRISVELMDVTFHNSSAQLSDGSAFLTDSFNETITPIMPSEFDFHGLFIHRACHRRVTGHSRTPDHCLRFGFRFHRIPYSYLMLIYCPSFIIVLISWISFWLDVDNPVPRITLGLTSLLTLTTQFSNAQDDLPPVAYIKALDVWMIVCLIMVFGSLVEFMLAHNFLSPQKNFNPVTNVRRTKILAPFINVKQEKVPAESTKTVNRFDAISRVLFPVVFAVFNVVYWPIIAITN